MAGDPAQPEPQTITPFGHCNARTAWSERRDVLCTRPKGHPGKHFDHFSHAEWD